MPHRFLLLDAIRGIAALLIVIRHTGAFWNGQPFQESYLAVDLFFCLSGFVLAHSYESRIAGGLSVSRFLAIRLIRLYPLYILGTAAAFALFGALIATGRISATMAQLSLTGAFSLFMLPSPLAFPSPRWWGPFYPLDNPAWSLLFELLANALFVLILRQRVDAMKVHVGILLLSAWGLVLTALVSPSALDAGTQWRTLWMALPRVGWSFFAGVVLHHVYAARPAPFTPVQSSCVAVPLVAGIVLCLALAPSPSWRWAYDVVAVTLVFPACIYCAARCRVPQWIAPACALLGASSYAVYMLHEPLGRLVEHTAGAVGLPVTAAAPWSGLVFVVVLVALCIRVGRLYDLPLRRAAMTWLDRKSVGRIGGKVG